VSSQTLQLLQRQDAIATGSIHSMGAPEQKLWKASPQSTQNIMTSLAPLEPQTKQQSSQDEGKAWSAVMPIMALGMQVSTLAGGTRGRISITST
jgi:hypothetical protein